MDHAAALKRAIDVAQACIGGRITAMQAAREMVCLVNISHPVWDELNGSKGPLVALYLADDRADQVGFTDWDIERWHPDVRERKRAEWSEAEADMTPGVHAACRALIEHAARSKID